MAEYRPLPESDLDTFRSYLSYAFDPTGEPFDPDSADELPGPATVGDRRVLMDDSAIVSVCVNIYFNARVRDTWTDLGGLSAVATPPEYRRQGNIESLLGSVLEEYREQGVYFSALWPFRVPFYEQFGWSVGNRIAVQTGPPDALSVSRNWEDGSFFEVDKDDWVRLHEVLMEHGDAYDLTVDRTEEWWKKRILEGWQEDPYVFGWECDDDVQGYLVYSIEETSDGKSRLEVRDMAYVDYPSRMNLLRFLANHQDQVDLIRLHGPVDSLLMDDIVDPDDMTLEIKHGPMVRITDVASAIESLEYSESEYDSFVVDVSDPLVDSNDGRFEIAFDEGQAVVSESSADPSIEINIGPLSQLVVGYRGIEYLVESETVTVNDDTVVPILESIFPERTVFLREGF